MKKRMNIDCIVLPFEFNIESIFNIEADEVVDPRQDAFHIQLDIKVCIHTVMVHKTSNR